MCCSRMRRPAEIDRDVSAASQHSTDDRDISVCDQWWKQIAILLTPLVTFTYSR